MQKDNVKFKIILLGILFFGIFGLAKSSWAEDFYITQNASGSDNGADCANAHSASWFNTGANWANPKQSGKIGPGDSSYLCGTISTRLATQASGTFENKITIKFEDNAKLSKPSWNGMALLIQKECIVIDGGTNGIIENTDNGTAGSYAYQQNAQGIWADSCNGCEVKNLTIRNLYIHNSNADTAIDNWMTKAIHINGSNLTVHDNIIHDAGSGIIVSYSIGDTNVRIYNNDIYNIDHGMALSSGGSNAGGKFYFYNNHVHDYKKWDTLSNAYHHDGIHAF